MPEQHVMSGPEDEPEVSEYVFIVDEDGVCIRDDAGMGLTGLKLDTAGGEAWLAAGLNAALGPALRAFLQAEDAGDGARRLLVNDAPGAGVVTPHACAMVRRRSGERVDTTVRLRPVGVVADARPGDDEFGRVLQQSPSLCAAIVRMPDWHCMRASPGLASLLGAREADLCRGRLVEHFARPGDPLRITECAAIGGSLEGITANLLSDQGERVPVLVSGQRIRFRGAPALLLLFTHSPDQHRLAELCAYDPLTTLPNRNQLLERLDCAVATADRRDAVTGVLFIDLDDFKKINDIHGHLVGDRLLTVTAQRLAGAVRGYDMVARFGGDEFVVVLEHLGGPSQAATVGQNLLNTLLQPLRIDGVAFQVSASIGVAVYPDDGDGAQGLLDAADNAMYRAKNTGARVVTASSGPSRSRSGISAPPTLVEGLVSHA